MYKNNCIILISVALCNGSIIFADQNDTSLHTSVELSQGYRRDRLDFKICRKNQVDTYNQKDQFTGVDVYTTRLGINLSKDDYFLKGVAGYGNIFGGKFRTLSDLQTKAYYGTEIFFKNKASLTGDYTADFSITFGKDFYVSKGWQISPTIGYGAYKQNFHTNHGHAHRDSTQRATQTWREKRYRYRASWYSPQIGLNVKKNITESLATYLNYSFLFPLTYNATAHDPFGSYKQKNQAYKSFGNIATVGLAWNFAKGWTVKPECEFMKFYSKGGDSGSFYKFKKATRTATEYRLALNYMF